MDACMVHACLRGLPPFYLESELMSPNNVRIALGPLTLLLVPIPFARHDAVGLTSPTTAPT